VDTAGDATIVDAARRQARWTPRLAWLAGYMPLRSTGVDSFRLLHPAADGRGVLIAILDTGVDPAVPGLQRTTRGDRKLLDVRDFSGEGDVRLNEVVPSRGGIIVVGDQRVSGFGQVAGRARRPYFAGVLREQALGVGPAADLNGNGTAVDEFVVVAARGSAGWFVVVDTDLDGSLDGETAVHDFAEAGEVLQMRSPDGGPGPFGLGVNVSESVRGEPRVAFVLDNSGHGTHVAGIAAGHDLFDVEGFDGVAPGAQLLGLRISNNARGGISVTGSMLRAMNHAVDLAARRRVPLVINLSYGVGHGHEGRAAIDSMVDEFTLKHPHVPVVVSLGNDGPGLSSTWLPASAEHAIAVCGLLPGVFARPPEPGVPAQPDRLRWWSSRGGEVVKPDICAPGIAYSSVPAWRAGDEISDGTSMAAPHVAGLAALLMSDPPAGRRPRAIDVKRALTNTARPLPGATVLDAGRGVADVSAAYRWLASEHQTGVYAVRALDRDGADRGVPGAYRRNGLPPGDTLQRFVVRSMDGQPAARLRMESDAAWLAAPELVEPERGVVTIDVWYDPERLTAPGVYVGTVWATAERDTLAGPSFGLTNTIVVPYELDGPRTWRGRLTPGGTQRFPVDVPPDAGGLVVRLTAEGSVGGTVHVFEPDGRPYRDRRSDVIGRGGSARVDVLGSDIIGGVYEVVVTAPPADSLSFALEVAAPMVRVLGAPVLARADVATRGPSETTAVVAIDWVGARIDARAAATGGAPGRVELDPPSWAAGLVLDVHVADDVWPRLTDFGVTVLDGDGGVLSAGPMSYAHKRGVVSFDSSGARPRVIELAPSFAHMDPRGEWSATVAITYIPAAPVPMPFDSLGTLDYLVPVGRDGATVRSRLPELPPVAEGFSHVVEIRATDPQGRMARWRGVVGRNE
jgi:subtilisin family serine protease